MHTPATDWAPQLSLTNYHLFDFWKKESLFFVDAFRVALIKYCLLSSDFYKWTRKKCHDRFEMCKKHFSKLFERKNDFYRNGFCGSDFCKTGRLNESICQRQLARRWTGIHIYKKKVYAIPRYKHKECLETNAWIQYLNEMHILQTPRSTFNSSVAILWKVVKKRQHLNEFGCCWIVLSEYTLHSHCNRNIAKIGSILFDID